MQQTNIDRAPPTIRISLDVGLPLGDAPKERLRGEIALRLNDVLRALGIPGLAEVEVTAESATPDDRLLRVRVDARPCRYSDELLYRAYDSVRGELRDPGMKLDRIRVWLSDLVIADGEGAENDSRATLFEFLGLTCVEIIKQHPAALLGSQQVAVYRDRLAALTVDLDQPLADWPPDDAWLQWVLAAVLNLRISVADTARVAKVLSMGLAKKRSQEDVVEDLIVALSPDGIEIQLHPDYLRQITTADSGQGQDNFALMRDGLFYELGIRYPDFRFVVGNGLFPNQFRFKLNHLTTMPRTGLVPDQCLANETSERLGLLNIEGRAVLNPANSNECSVISTAARSSAESAGLATWDAIGYLILSFAAELREHSRCFVHVDAISRVLEDAKQVFPALVNAAQARFRIQQITRLLRTLVTEQISFRNLRLILESLLDYDYIVIDPAEFIVFDARMPSSRQPDEAWLNDPSNLASFVRSRMKRYISHKYTRGRNTLVVYLLDREIETMIAADRAMHRAISGEASLDEEDAERIIEAARLELGAFPAAGMPAILTSIDTRPIVHQLLVAEFPGLPVLAYQELAPDMNIQAIGRISLKD